MAENEPAVQIWNQRIVEEFDATGGRVGGPFEGAALALAPASTYQDQTSRPIPVVALHQWAPGSAA
ncbi:hypothetical protein ACQPWW_03500 [Micromonospora sp. CA-240977]|uniref:hypothetical protein n=1 Tax=Micromonospora sp. CA-240977 TaxID=3239957 RepID=UPI003D8A0F3A